MIQMGQTVPVKSLARALGLPSGKLRSPYRNMAGEALARGVQIIKELGLVERYGYSIYKE